jgi:solute carrier family 35 (UDP-galactose transporter), member B1
MMSSINGWSTLLIAIPIVILNEEVEFFNFATEFPRVLLDMGGLAISGTMGQIFIFTMVSMFGALACSIATTIRKVITLMFSVIFFKNILVTRQWLGAALVFGALFGDMIFKKKPQN